MAQTNNIEVIWKENGNSRLSTTITTPSTINDFMELSNGGWGWWHIAATQHTFHDHIWPWVTRQSLDDSLNTKCFFEVIYKKETNKRFHFQFIFTMSYKDSQWNLLMDRTNKIYKIIQEALITFRPILWSERFSTIQMCVCLQYFIWQWTNSSHKHPSLGRPQVSLSPIATRTLSDHL